EPWPGFTQLDYQTQVRLFGSADDLHARYQSYFDRQRQLAAGGQRKSPLYVEYTDENSAPMREVTGATPFGLPVFMSCVASSALSETSGTAVTIPQPFCSFNLPLAEKANLTVRFWGEKLTDGEWEPFVHDLERLVGGTLTEDDLA